ncbi:peptidoglycan-binding protein [Streptomyces sp. V2I9]|uniref:peptidoglycan-binding domain-containing protein n=1 Tax=Streptomyces sp. V2I9 TaxID=3042304 RepID=UPI002787FC09|nr:peptidoglycan-binding domain-containing protein [Streptomyces sp. V2I9]MDQ0986121.1 peptidoglycan hydrolase-like protein with peptidoglycan-binding domain [Streptomyces sp. V2I9]
MSMRSSTRFRGVFTGAAVCSALALGTVLAGPGTAAASTETGQSSTAASVQAACSVYWKVGVDYAGLTAGYSWAWNVVIEQGATGDRVREIQCLLGYHGYGLTVDGQFGPATYNAVTSFQRARGIGVDGIVGPSTWRQLRK